MTTTITSNIRNSNRNHRNNDDSSNSDNQNDNNSKDYDQNSMCNYTRYSIHANVQNTYTIYNKKTDLGQVTEMSSQVRNNGHQQYECNWRVQAVRVHPAQHSSTSDRMVFTPEPPIPMLQ